MFDQSREIIIALDLSRSMQAPDVKPTRLERSKLLIQSLLDRLRGERVGASIIFSGTAFLQSPVSADYEILREFLPALGPDFLPEGGTNYTQLIDTALDAFGETSAADRYLIILSDGEATDDGWKGRVSALAKRGIHVIGLGVGTTAGAMIPDGEGGFMKDDNGAVVLSRLESATLRQLAGATRGVYRDASDWVDLSKVLQESVDAGRKGRFVEHDNVRLVERFQWALAPAFLCLLASFWLEFPVRPKSREVRLSVPAAKAKASLAGAAAALWLCAASGRAAEEPSHPADPAASLSKVVGRLADQDVRSALDWAELGNDTVAWGQHLRSESQKVPERPVRDALQAVDLGSGADLKAADWPHMRSELEALLTEPEDKQNPQPQKQDQDKKQQKQNEKDSKQDSQSKNSKQDKAQDSKPQDSKQQDSSPQQKPGESQKPQDQGGRQEPKTPQGDKAFDGMGKPAPTPTPRDSGQVKMQKVGGVKKDQPDDPARSDPELAVPLEKLEQLKNEDSPAELYQMLRQGEPIPPQKNTGPQW